MHSNLLFESRLKDNIGKETEFYIGFLALKLKVWGIGQEKNLGNWPGFFPVTYRKHLKPQLVCRFAQVEVKEAVMTNKIKILIAFKRKLK